MGQFVVLGTNTNHDDAVYGPFGSEEEAHSAKFSKGGADQMHEYKVLPLLGPDELGVTFEREPYEADKPRMGIIPDEPTPGHPGEGAEVWGDQEDHKIEPGEESPTSPANESNAEDKDLAGGGIGQDNDQGNDLGPDGVDDDEDVDDDRTMKDLRARAAELDIAGRSSMSRDELVAAIEEAEEDEEG